MNKNTKAEPIPALAEHWARKGSDELEKMQATLNLAHQFLVSEEIQQYAEGENPFDPSPQPWEVTEARSDARKRIFLGTVSDLAMGTGHTVYFAAGLARDEDEFRRQLASHIGQILADGVTLSSDLGDFRLPKLFVSPLLQQNLKKFDQGEDPPAAFFYIAQWHENSS